MTWVPSECRCRCREESGIFPLRRPTHVRFSVDVIGRKPGGRQFVELCLIAVIQQMVVELQKFLSGTSRNTVEPTLRIKLALTFTAAVVVRPQLSGSPAFVAKSA